MQKVTKFLINVVKQAAKITTKSFNIYAKDNQGDIVTDIDRQVEEFIVSKMAQQYPNFSIVSEEYNPDKELTNNCFIIDPIDGTKNFAAGLPLWGIQVSACQNGEMCSAVIYLPRLNELYYADSDGTFLNGERLVIDATIKNKTPIYAVDGGDKLPTLTKLETEINRNFRYLSSASVAYCWVAAGRMSGFSFRKNTKWDYLPGMYLVKMAGGYTLDKPGAHIGATTEKIMNTLAKYPNEK